jgi:acyl-CoA-binding protein
MSELEEQFKQAGESVTKLAAAPSNEDKLKLYGLFKQGSEGDASGKRPGMFDPVGRAKWDAWAGNKGKSQDEAKQAYIDLVRSLGG